MFTSYKPYVHHDYSHYERQDMVERTDRARHPRLLRYGRRVYFQSHDEVHLRADILSGCVINSESETDDSAKLQIIIDIPDPDKCIDTIVNLDRKTVHMDN